MGSTAITGELIWPSQNDHYGSAIGGAVGEGKQHLEKQWRKLALPIMGQNNYVLTGGTLPATDPDLTIQVAAGTAILDGHFVQWPATNITVPNTATSHLFLKLVFSGGLITGAEIEDNTANSPPASSTKLGTVTAVGGVITATTDARILGPGAAIELTSGTSWVVPAGIFRVFAELDGASGGGEGEDTTGNVSGDDGGTTTFNGTLTANGGSGGPGGLGAKRGNGSWAEGASQGAHGTASGGAINQTGCGMPGSLGGAAGLPDAPGSSLVARSGRTGGNGGKCAGWVSVTPGATVSYTIGARGTAGPGGNGVGTGNPGSTGTAGLSGCITLYL